MPEIRFCERCGGSIPAKEASAVLCIDCRPLRTDERPTGTSQASPAPSFPLVRFGEGWRRKLLAVYEDFLLFGAFRARTSELTESMLTPHGVSEIVGILRKPRRIVFRDILQVRVKVEASRQYKQGAATRNVDVFTLQVRGARKLRFAVETAQSLPIREVFTRQLGERLKWKKAASRGALWGMVVTASILLVFAGILVAMHPAWGLAVAGLSLTALVVWIVTRRSPWRSVEIKPAALVKPSPVASAKLRLPFRSRPLGWVAKSAGLAWWLVVASPLSDGWDSWISGSQGSQARQWFWWAVWAPAPLLVFLGYRLGQRAFVLREDAQKQGCVVYLRPFLDDGVTSMQPSGLLMGRSRPELADGSVSLRDVAGTVNPVAILRMAFGRGVMTAEESVVRFAEKRAPVVAIGRPGERLATPGAMRLYVEDAAWQDAVTRLLSTAPFVVVQPGGGGGVAWELAQVRQHVSPRRVLFCMVGSWNRPAVHERVVASVASAMGVHLPRVLPFLGYPVFVRFDDEWTPHVVPVQYRHPCTWPLIGDATDLEATLRPFLASLEGRETSEAEPSRPRRVVRWWANLAGMAVAALALIVPMLALRLAFVAATPEVTTADLVVDSKRVPLRGASAPYRIVVPAALKRQTPESELVEHDMLSEDRRFRVVVFAAAETSDFDKIHEERVAAYRAQNCEAVVDGLHWSTVGRHKWVQMELRVRRPEDEIEETVRATSTRDWSLLVIVQRARADDTNEAYDALAGEVIESLRVVEDR